MPEVKPNNKWVGEGKVEKIYYEGKNTHEFALGIVEQYNGKDYNKWIRCTLPVQYMTKFAVGDIIRVIGKADVKTIEKKDNSGKSYVQFMRCDQGVLVRDGDSQDGSYVDEESQLDPEEKQSSPQAQEADTDDMGWIKEPKKQKWS